MSVEEQLTEKMKNKPQTRLFVNGEYIVEDCFAYYKSEQFKLDRPVRSQNKLIGQRVADDL